MARAAVAAEDRRTRSARWGRPEAQQDRRDRGGEVSW